jgi:hypothetical protein
MEIKSTIDYNDKPRFLIYGNPGDGKTALAATIATPGKRDVLFGSTEGGLQTIGHMDLPYVDLRRVKDYDELVKMLRAGKPDGTGGIQIDSKHYIRGVVIDLFGELVQMELIDLLMDSKRYKDDPTCIDDPSEYEYKRLNFRMIRQIRALRDLPLQYVGFTAYCQEQYSETGALTSSKPAFVGSKIWVAASGAVSYVFRVSPPRNAAEAKEKRVIRLQSHPIHYAKSRVPGVGGKLPLPDETDWKAGDATMLTRLFTKVDEHLAEARKGVTHP